MTAQPGPSPRRHPVERGTTLLLRRRPTWPGPCAHKFCVTYNSTSFPASFSNFRVPSGTEQRSPGQGSLDWTPQARNTGGRAARVGRGGHAGPCAGVGAAGAAARPGGTCAAPAAKGARAARRADGPTHARTHARPRGLRRRRGPASRPASRERVSACRALQRASCGPRRRAPAVRPPPTGPLSSPPTCWVFWRNLRNILPARCAEQRGAFPEVTLKWPRGHHESPAPAKSSSPARGTWRGFSFSGQRTEARLAGLSDPGRSRLGPSPSAERSLEPFRDEMRIMIRVVLVARDLLGREQNRTAPGSAPLSRPGSKDLCITRRTHKES